MSEGRVVFVVALPPKALRRNVHTVARRNPKPGQSARRALHWSDRSKAAEEYAEQVWIAAHSGTYDSSGGGLQLHTSLDGYLAGKTIEFHTGGMTYVCNSPWPRARVHYRWHSTHQMDQDNIISSMKVALDCLTSKGRRPLSIIEDDRGVEISAEWRKVAHRKDERVEITVEEVRD